MATGLYSAADAYMRSAITASRPPLPKELPPETEKAFQAAIVDAAQRLGWKTYHTFDSRRSASGFPDLVCVRRGRVLAIELKSERGRVSEKQQEWLTALKLSGKVEVFIWRPSQKTEILEVLR